MDIARQLELVGLEETKRQVTALSPNLRERNRLIKRVETTHEILSALPEGEDLSFLHTKLQKTPPSLLE